MANSKTEISIQFFHECKKALDETVYLCFPGEILLLQGGKANPREKIRITYLLTYEQHTKFTNSIRLQTTKHRKSTRKPL